MPEAGAPTELRYLYRVRLWIALLAGAFFVLAAVVLVDAARTNDRGMTINHLIELDISEATTFLWTLVGASVVFVLIALALIWQRFARERYLVVGGDMVVVPNPWRRNKEQRIAYPDIRALKAQSVQLQHFLTIEHADGKAVLNASMLPNRAAFDAACEAITERVLAVRKD